MKKVKKGEFIDFNYEYKKIKFLSDNDSFPSQLLYFNELIVVTRCVFKLEDILYPQLYLEGGKYGLYK